jgi:hypothetical protein
MDIVISKSFNFEKSIVSYHTKYQLGIELGQEGM